MLGAHQVHFLHLGECIVFKYILKITSFSRIKIYLCFLTSSSGDSTARIWTIADGTCRSNMQNGPASVVVLKHFKGRIVEKSKDVTTLDWNVSVCQICT